MKTAVVEKIAGAGKNPTRLPRAVRETTRRVQKEQKAVSTDPQVTEFERTFSVRWEW